MHCQKPLYSALILMIAVELKIFITGLHDTHYTYSKKLWMDLIDHLVAKEPCTLSMRFSYLTRGNTKWKNNSVESNWFWGHSILFLMIFLPYMVWWHPVTSLLSFLAIWIDLCRTPQSLDSSKLRNQSVFIRAKLLLSILVIWIDNSVDWYGINPSHPCLDYLYYRYISYKRSKDPGKNFDTMANVWNLAGNYIPVRHDISRQTNDCSPVRVMQHKVMYFLYPT